MTGWFETHRAVVHQWQCDHLGHLNVRYYAHFFDDAGFHFWTGIPEAQTIMKAHNIGVVVARTTNDFLHEARAGELVVIRSALTRLGSKSLTYTQRLSNAEDDTLLATQDAVEVIFDPAARKATEMPAPLRAVLQAALVRTETQPA
jgi:acyl-CoA thioester hydrolase